MIESFKDWLGQDIRVGDTVLYCQVSGRSANMALATVVTITEAKHWRMGPHLSPLAYISSVSVRKLDAARWKPNTSAGSHWEDSRKPGKHIDPWARSGVHIANAGETGVRCLVTGALVDHRYANDGCRWQGDKIYGVWHSYRENHSPAQTRYVSTKFKDYVVSVPNDQPKPVTLTAIGNITRWPHDVPAGG